MNVSARRATVFSIALATFALSGPSLAQTAAVFGQVVLAEGGQPVGYATVSILPDGGQLLTNESGRFTLPSLPAGDLRLRIKRIGFIAKDTTIRLGAADTVRLRIAMARLVIQLPEMVVSGKCTNESPFAAKSAELTELFDQVKQNAEQVMLLTKQQPFLLFVHRVRGFRNRNNKVIAELVDTVVRHPLPKAPYEPKKVVRNVDYGSLQLALPELPDIADTAFTNHHCFSYAGKTTWYEDSVIQVDFEPTPWLNRDVDIKGSVYLKSQGYQLVGSVTALNRIPPTVRRGGVEAVSVRAKFTEIVTGVPVLDEWEMVSSFGKKGDPRVELGQVFNIKWIDSTGKIADPDPPPVPLDTANVRTLVQRFYDMYNMLRTSQGALEARTMVSAASPPLLGADITRLLRDDAAARRAQPAPTRDTLSVDAFTGTTAGCPRYRVGAVRQHGDTAAAFVHSVCPSRGADSVSAAPVRDVVLSRRSGRWEIVDFFGPEGSLTALLCRYALDDRDPARRPHVCP